MENRINTLPKLTIPLLVFSIPCGVYAKSSTARELQLLDMRTRVLKPYNGPDRPITRGTIGHFRDVQPKYSSREIRQNRMYRQNAHRREWQRRRALHRYNRSSLN